MAYPTETIEVENAKKVLRDAGYIIRYWHEDDLHSRFEENCPFEGEPKLTKDEVDYIIADLEEIGADIGINWESLDVTISDVIDNREDEKEYIKSQLLES